MTEHKDHIYADEQSQGHRFTFDERVANVFSDMINRSVPGYAMNLEMIGVIAGRHVKPDSHCYDLGCSLGASTLAIHSGVKAGNRVKLFAVDNSSAMVERCRANLNREHSAVETEVRLEDIEQTEISNASVVVMNFTLQFIALKQRSPLLKKIYDGMLTGGALMSAEKIAFSNEQEQQLMTNLHHNFKRGRGYSDLEIAQKRSALEDVLIPETKDAHIQRLREAGFSQVSVFFQCFNFVSFLAVK